MLGDTIARDSSGDVMSVVQLMSCHAMPFHFMSCHPRLGQHQDTFFARMLLLLLLLPERLVPFCFVMKIHLLPSWADYYATPPAACAACAACCVMMVLVA